MKALVELDIPTDSALTIYWVKEWDVPTELLLVPGVVSLQKKEVSNFRAGWQASYFRKEIIPVLVALLLKVERVRVLHYLCLEKTHLCP